MLRALVQGHPACQHLNDMGNSDSREQLMQVLKRALDDSQYRPEKLDVLMEQYPFLSRAERSALVHISNWEADEFLRRNSPKFAEFSRSRLTNLLATLD